MNCQMVITDVLKVDHFTIYLKTEIFRNLITVLSLGWHSLMFVKGPFSLNKVKKSWKAQKVIRVQTLQGELLILESSLAKKPKYEKKGVLNQA